MLSWVAVSLRIWDVLSRLHSSMAMDSDYKDLRCRESAT